MNGEFQDNLADVTGRDPPGIGARRDADPQKAHARAENARLAALRRDEFEGVRSGSIEGTNRFRHIDKHKEDARKRATKEGARTDTMLFLMMLEENFAKVVADQFVGSMSDDEIADMVAEIEAQLGMPFEEAAATVLGKDGAARQPGESDDAYRRRVLAAVAEEITDPETGGVKPEHADNALAQLIYGDERYQAAMLRVRDIKDQYEAGVPVEQLQPQVEVLLEDRRYDTAKTVGYALTHELSDTARVGQDDLSDVAFDQVEQVVENDDGFGGFGTLAEVAEKAPAHFAAAAAPRNEPEIEIAVKVDPAAPKPFA